MRGYLFNRAWQSMLTLFLATVVVYTGIVAGLVFLILLVAQALSTSITEFVASIPTIRADIASIVAPTQDWLAQIGLGQGRRVGQVGGCRR